MGSFAHRFEGGCHCGNLAYVFEATAPLATLGLRACMCGFCRAHGARNTSDPGGAMRIAVKDEGKLRRYRFGLRTADFLVCTECGVYIGALLSEGGESWFTVNANTFADRPAPDFPLAPHDFGGENTQSRVARRTARWTPVVQFSCEAA
ncbi:MAG TPA: hypothetical protein VMH86_04230 [Rhizomicrobium sp.]|nr:hypothetical protein [Rhizomicrobium sp.]